MKTHAIGKYNLRFDYNALCKAEDILGPLPAIVTDSMRMMSLSARRAFIYAGLQHERAVTLEEAGDIAQELTNELGADAVMNIVGTAISEAFPTAKGGNKSGKKKAA